LNPFSKQWQGSAVQIDVNRGFYWALNCLRHGIETTASIDAYSVKEKDPFARGARLALLVWGALQGEEL